MTSPTAPATHILAAGTELHRIHRPGLEAQLSTDIHGRFNLSGGEHGTCYLATEPLGAFVETLGRIRTRTTDDIEARLISTVSFDHDLNLLDLVARANRHMYAAHDLDLNQDITAGADYTDPQRLARLVHEDGFDGIHYATRHDSAHQMRSIALFDANTATAAGGRRHPYSAIKTTAIPVWLIEQAATEFGFNVIDDEPLP